jgi:hypothetical protein
MKSFQVVDTAFSVPGESTRQRQAYPFHIFIVKCNRHGARIDGIPCFIHIAVTAFWIPVSCYRLICSRSIERQSTCISVSFGLILERQHLACLFYLLYKVLPELCVATLILPLSMTSSTFADRESSRSDMKITNARVFVGMISVLLLFQATPSLSSCWDNRSSSSPLLNG